MAFADASIGALKELGRDPKKGVWLHHWSVFSLLLGLTMEQQAHEPVRADSLRAAVTSSPYPGLSHAETSTHPEGGRLR